MLALGVPRYYCDYCDTYLTHDSVSHAATASAFPSPQPSTVQHLCCWCIVHPHHRALQLLLTRAGYPRSHGGAAGLWLQPSVRKTHNSGRKHREHVRMYYEEWVKENVPGGLMSLMPAVGMGMGMMGMPMGMGMGMPMGMMPGLSFISRHVPVPFPFFFGFSRYTTAHGVARPAATMQGWAWRRLRPE